MLFKILHGDESRISTDITPFHEGWAYVTKSGSYYVDMNIGTVEAPNNQRIKLNAKDAETIAGVSLDELKALISNQDAVILSEAQEDASNKVAVVLAEAQQGIDALSERIDTLEAGSAGATSWNDLTDRPFYGKVIDPIIWDGNVDGKDVVTVSYDDRYRYVKVSDQYFESQDLVGGKFTLCVADSNRSAEMNISDYLIESCEGFGMTDSASWLVTDGSEPNIFVIHSEEYCDDWGLFTPGVYILAKYLEFDPNIVSIYVSKITFPFNGKTINDKYIPDTIARVADIEEALAEVQANASSKAAVVLAEAQRGINALNDRIDALGVGGSGQTTSASVTHGETTVSDIIETYILNIDYDTLAFDTSEIVVNNTNTTSVLGQAILGQMILA